MFSKEDEDIQKFIKGCFKLIYSYAKDDFTNGELYSIWHIILFVKFILCVKVVTSKLWHLEYFL